MKHRFSVTAKNYVALIFTVLLIFMSVFSVCGASGTEIWDSLNLYSSKEYNPTPSSIQCFDVNDNEQILVTLNNIDRLIIFDSNGYVERQFGFNSPGSFSARFNKTNNNIQLFLVRGNCYVEFTQNGEFVKSFSCGYNDWQRTSGFEQSYTVNGNIYSLEKAPLTISDENFARLVKTEGKGNETVFYDVTSPQICRNILLIGMFLMILVIAPLFFVCIILKNVRDRRSRYPAPPRKTIPISAKQKVLKRSIIALLLAKIAFTIVKFIITIIAPFTYFSFISTIASYVIAAATKDSIWTMLFLCIPIMITICLTLGIVFLLTLKHKPTPAMVFLCITQTSDILFLIGSLFNPNYIASKISALVLNLCIVALLFGYRHITLKNRSKYLS